MSVTILWKLCIAASPARVYGALNRSDERSRYWAESAEEASGHIEFIFKDRIHESSEILRRVEDSVWSIRYFGGVLEIELDQDGDGGTILTLRHHGIAIEDYPATYAGWLNVLFPLKAWVQHGVELRNHDPARSWSAGYADG